MKKNNKHIFFVRADNDLDHLIPIIDLIFENKKNINFEIVTRDPLRDFSDDYRIKYLKKKIEFKISDLIILNNKSFSSIQVRFFRSIYWKLLYSKNYFLSKLYSFICIYIHKYLIILKNKKESKILLNDVFIEKPSTITCDNSVDEFVLKCKKYCVQNKIKLIAFSHSIPHVNSKFMKSTFSLFLKKNISTSPLSIFDKIFIPNDIIKAKLLYENVQANSLEIIGSPRFFDRWINKLVKMSTNNIIKKSNSRKNILLIASKMQEHINSREIFLLLNSLINDSRFNLIIKPHTRNGRTGLPKKIISNSIVEYNKSTVELVEESDLVVFWSTSFIYHVISRNKPIFLIKYVYSLPFDFEKYISSWNIYNRNDFVEKINSFYENNSSWKKIYKNQIKEFRILKNKMVVENIDNTKTKLDSNYE
tara:strand:+ start:9410 stop:10669 length:1260 start_codon:yes stop_codon:yes gene_type:complete